RTCCARVLFKAARVVGLETWLVAFRIKRRLAALRRGERDVGPGVTEYEIGRSEFLEPKPRLPAGVSQLIMRRENHENLHIACLAVWVGGEVRPANLRNAGSKHMSPA